MHQPLGDRPASEWHAYQVKVANFFQDLGMTASTDARIQGVRTSHDIDVLVEFEHAGLSLVWLVECKYWKRRVSKDHILTLRTIVEDTGADRGFVLSESGFQSGAREATHKANVTLASLGELRGEAQEHLLKARLNALPERLARDYRTYWDIPKGEREARGLRPESFAGGYSGALVLTVASDMLISTLAGLFPPPIGHAQEYTLVYDSPVNSLSQAVTWIERVLDDLEMRLDHDRSVVSHQPLPTVLDRKN